MPISIVVNFLWTRFAVDETEFLTSLLVILHELFPQSGVIVMLYCPHTRHTGSGPGKRKKQTEISGDLEQSR